MAAKNNGLELTIDRTPPVLTVDEHILTNQSFKFNAVIEDLLPTMTSWQQVSGPGNVTFDDANSATPTISMTVDGSYALQMQTADQAGNQSTKMITVVWDTTPPTVAAIADQLAGMPLLITPAVTSTLFDDPLTYSWSVVSGPGIITPAMPYPAKNITVSANTKRQLRPAFCRHGCCG